MVRHIVAFQLVEQDPALKQIAAESIRDRLESLATVIPGVRSIVVGIDAGILQGHWDAALVSEHDDFEALAEYQAHPEHVAAVAFINPLVENRAVVDFALD